MATKTTRIVSARVPVAVARRLREDAASLRESPGSLLRRILEARYSVSRDVGNSSGPSGNTHEELEIIE